MFFIREHLSELINNANVFVILPKSENPKRAEPFFAHFTEEDYRRSLLAQDLYDMGLAQKPANFLFIRNLHNQ